MYIRSYWSAWKERLPEILRGYDKKNVYNLDEMGASGKFCPNVGIDVTNFQICSIDNLARHCCAVIQEILFIHM